MTIRILVSVTVAESVRRGRATPPKTVLAVTDAELAALSDADRTLLSSCLSDYDSTALRAAQADVRLVPPGCSDGYLSIPEPTLAGALEGIRAWQAEAEQKARAKAEHEAATAARYRTEALAILAARRTKAVVHALHAWRVDDTVHLGEWSDVPNTHRHRRDCVLAHYTTSQPDWSYYAPADVTASPDAVAWQAELDAANAAARTAAEATARAAFALEEQAAAAAVAERDAWIAAHGSRRLQRMVAEGIACQGAYRDERLALERPGWLWAAKAPGSEGELTNPPAEAFDVLDEARQVDPEARLAYWTVDSSTDEYGEDAHDDWKGYVAVATFLGKEIVYGLPADVVAE